jgi:broad-specificity NMP kinase
MPLFLLTGSAGTGKTTICQKLREKGYEAYDTDNDGLSKWQNIETGYIHPKSSVKDVERTPEFLKVHAWNIPRQDIEELHDKSTEKIIFLCGVLDNLTDVRDLFDGVFALFVDDETLKHRLDTRTSGDWGKQEHELEHTLENHHIVYDRYRELGAKVIDATKPIDLVVEDIVANALQVQ